MTTGDIRFENITKVTVRGDSCIIEAEQDNVSITGSTNMTEEELIDSIPGKFKLLSYYPNSQLKIDIEYEDGKFNGSYKRWFADGQIESDKNYQNGMFHGRCREWNQEGNLTFDRTYHNGLPT